MKKSEKNRALLFAIFFTVDDRLHEYFVIKSRKSCRKLKTRRLGITACRQLNFRLPFVIE